MPAKSKQQQKFMGIVRAIQKGDEPASKFSKDAQDAAKDMKKKDVEDFASTKHKGLPKKVEQYLRQQIRKSVEEIIREDWFDRLSPEDQKKYVKAHPGSKKAKQHAWDKKRDRRAAKISSKDYTIDGDGNIIKVKKLSKSEKAKEEKRRAKHLAAIKKGYFPGDDNYNTFMKEDYVETCGYTQSVDGKKLKTPGGTGKEDRELKESTKMTGARGLVSVPDEYVGKLGKVQYNLMKKLGYTRGGTHLIIADMHWGKNSRNRIKPNDQFSSSIILKSSPEKPFGNKDGRLRKKDVMIVLKELMRQLKANRLRLDKKPVYRPDVNNPMIEFRVNPEQFNESVNENRMYKKGDIVSLLSFDRRQRGKARVKGVTKARPNKFGIKNHYITNKGTFSDMEVEGTKAFKLRFKGNTEKKVMKVMGLESVNEIRNKREAETLLQQLGGNKFKMMTGAKNFGIDGKSLTFSIGRNSKGINFVRIKLTSMDLYDIQFAQLRMGQVKVKSTAKRVYGDQLGKVFKKHTGMNVRLFGETINEASVSQARSIVKRVKKQLMKKWAKKGGYENFGQKELRKMKDKLDYNPYGSPQERQISKMLDAFNDWAMNYSGDMRESINEAPKNYDRAMKKMLDFMKKSAYKQYKKRFPFYIESNTWQYPKLLKKGRTFDKLVTVRNNAPNKAQSADFFVHRETGDIYKAASWSSPAKGRRGSIFEPNTYKHYDIHGGWLYRRR